MDNQIVNAWEEKVTIPTYGTGLPDKNPMFFEKRVYQGSSGVVYPNPIIEKICDEKKNKAYTALYLENQYIKVMILPELGGRIQMAYDKLKKRHFVYYNQVIKPALVGLTGPWISGGIEFNWPQHHRPSTFEPIDYMIAENSDGSKTVWVNEIEKMFHTKGMAGFTLHPGKAYIEINVKLYNGSTLPQTFLWWANPAVKVNDEYQSVFPPDVNAVFDHGKRDVSAFPIATGTYYKVDYSPGTDISRYKNIPVPTSYMAINSAYDFVGGYEHDNQAGLLHVADHQISPGKKQWTWGNGDFGKAWDRNLTDEDGPYIELMTGVFTDNQPDFTWLMPHEQKSFTQYFMPYRELGVIKNASKDLMIAVSENNGCITLKVFATSLQPNREIKMSYDGKVLIAEEQDFAPEQMFEKSVSISGEYIEELLIVSIGTGTKELLRYEPALNKKNELPLPAKPAPQPEEMESSEQLFLTGQHLEQYRHATYSPVPYYEEALRRDPDDSRSNNALGLWYVRRGNFIKSEPYFRKAIATITGRNPNPYDSEPFYNLGLCLKYVGRIDEAYEAFYKATWSSAWKNCGNFSISQILMGRGDYESALAHITMAIDFNANDNKAYVIKAAALRKLHRIGEAIDTCHTALWRDRFNLGALFELRNAFLVSNQEANAENRLKEMIDLSRGTAQNFLEYAFDYAAAGLFSEAADLLTIGSNENAVSPMVCYSLAWFYHNNSEPLLAGKWLAEAANADPYLCFPNRLEEITVLDYASAANPADALPAYLLGNLFYDKRQYETAINYWEKAATINDQFPTVFRNLGLAYFNKRNDTLKALSCYEKAFALEPTDARVLMELDQLYKRLNKPATERLKLLEKNAEAVDERDDLYLERITLYNLAGNYQKALDLLLNHSFHPWEGGEGKVTEQYVYSLLSLATASYDQGEFAKAIDLLVSAQNYPHNLGEGKLFGVQENDIFYWFGLAYKAMGNEELAQHYLWQASKGTADLRAAVFYNDQQPDKMFYQGMALKQLGQEEAANQCFNRLISFGSNHMNDEIAIDYFAVSLPDLLVFEDDLNARNKLHCLYLQGLGNFGLQNYAAAKDFLEQVLAKNAMHSGSNFHLQLLKYSNLIQSQTLQS